MRIIYVAYEEGGSGVEAFEKGECNEMEATRMVFSRLVAVDY